MNVPFPRLPAALAALLVGSAVILVAAVGPETPVPGPARAAPDGRALYLEHCASCHGERGFGDGEAAYLLYPRARDFSAYTFRIVSTDNGVPTDQDLLDVVTRGMLGSAMPPHDHLPEADRRAIVAEVRRLMTEEAAKRLLEEAAERGEDLEEKTAREIAFRKPGRVLEPPPVPEAGPELLAEGRHLYVVYCGSCHGPDGTGRGVPDLKDTKGRPLFARDFTAGIMKGGTGELAMFRRIRCGMPGTPMPAHELDPREMWALIRYVRSLIRPGAQEHLSQERLDLVAQRVPGELGDDPRADVWKDVPRRWVALTRLWWSDDRVEGVLVQAAHDGRRLALRLEWEDPSEDARQVRQDEFSDACALQLSEAENPPFFAMGAKDRSVEISYWRAAYTSSKEGWTDVQSAHPRVVNDIDLSLKDPPFGSASSHSEHDIAAHDPLFLTGWGAGNAVSDPTRRTPVRALTASGFGTLEARKGPRMALSGRGVWERGIWRVVIVRDLEGGGASALAPGGEASIGFAVWDGAAGDRNGQKNVSIWHRLRLEP